MKQHSSHVSAFVLHLKSYQENSQIIQLFSYELGRFSVIAKGIKSSRSQPRKAILQPFVELLIEYTGKSDLKTLLNCELIKQTTKPFEKVLFSLQGKNLACGYYANELLIRACPERQEYPELYSHYQGFIEKLIHNQTQQNAPIQPILRGFEVELLNDIGLAPDCLFDIEGNEIEANKNYMLILESGFKPVDTASHKNLIQQSDNLLDCYSGQSILSLVTGQHYPQYYKQSQRITAAFLRQVIGNKPLQSRKLWQHLNLN